MNRMTASKTQLRRPRKSLCKKALIALGQQQGGERIGARVERRRPDEDGKYRSGKEQSHGQLPKTQRRRGAERAAKRDCGRPGRVWRWPAPPAPVTSVGSAGRSSTLAGDRSAVPAPGYRPAPASVAFLNGHVLRTRGRGLELCARAGLRRSCMASTTFHLGAMGAPRPAQ